MPGCGRRRALRRHCSGPAPTAAVPQFHCADRRLDVAFLHALRDCSCYPVTASTGCRPRGANPPSCGGANFRVVLRDSVSESSVGSPIRGLAPPEMEADMEGWWCVRHGDPLAWVEAPSAPAALRRSLVLHVLGDWTNSARELVVVLEDAGFHDYTRAVLSAAGLQVPSSRSRGSRDVMARSGRSLRRRPNSVPPRALRTWLLRPVRYGFMTSRAPSRSIMIAPKGKGVAA